MSYPYPLTDPGAALATAETKVLRTHRRLQPFAARFDIQSRRLLGGGAHGVVFRVRERPRNGRLAVAKVARRLEPTTLEAIRNEVEVLELARPPVAPMVQGLLYHRPSNSLVGFTTPHVPGQTLASLLSKGPLEPEAVERIGRALIEAVLELGKCGVVHRDLKPAHVLVTDAGGALLLDFGLARRIGDDCERRGVSCTPQYASPEQLEGGRQDARSDLFTTGLILYELVEANPLFREAPGTAEECRSLQRRRLELGLEISRPCPAWMRQLIGRLLADDPRWRADTAEVTALLGAI